jgi:ribonucleoside-diphosphate reductase alpha chain
MRKHQAANDAVRTMHPLDQDVHRLATQAWADVLAIGTKNGWRNAQALGARATGTIGLMMDCDTTGSSPTSRWSSSRSSSAAGRCRSSTRQLPAGAAKLGYARRPSRRSSSTSPSTATSSTHPAFDPEHYEVFDCAMGERAIKPMGHVRMMAACPAVPVRARSPRR